MQNPWLTDIPRSTNPLRFLWYVSKPYRRWLYIAIAMVMFASFATAGVSYAFKAIVNSATDLAHGAPYTPLIFAAVFYVCINFSTGLFWRLSGFSGMRWAVGARATARYALTAYLTQHSYRYFSDHFAGSLGNKVSHASSGVRSMVEQILWNFLNFGFALIAGFFITFITNHLIAYVFLAWVCVITPLNLYLAKKRVAITSEGQKLETALNGNTIDMLTNMTAVQEYARRDFELLRLKTAISARRVAGLRNWTYGEWVLVLNNVLQVFFIGGMIALAIVLVQAGTISAGDIILVLTIVVFMEDRLTFIGSQMNTFSETWGEIRESLEEILDAHEVVNADGAKAIQVPRGAITLERVSFSYGGVEVFKDVSLSINAGERVGVVGRSGAGKSTLMKLLLRHYDLNDGKILFDEEDIATVTKDSVRRSISVVPQEPLLFHRSVRENIAYGNPEATEEEIKRAASLAQADAFIERLPQGYEALVGERGVKLSGGQRQRVAIARAFLKNAPILLLDEATSSLDSESEVAVQKALFTLMEGRTVIAIAHRLSTLRAMNRIIVMDDGKIIEDGTHESLLALGGVYAALWNHQAGGFLED